MKFDPLIERELRGCPLPWSLEARKRHLLLRIGGRAVTILSTSRHAERGHAAKNVRAVIRRTIREHQA